MSAPRTIRTAKAGKVEIRLVLKDGIYHGVASGKMVCQGEDADKVWMALHDEVGKADPKYFGFAGARSRFLRFFPGGFASTEYSKEERDYKLIAKALLDETAPLEAAAEGQGLGEAVTKVFQKTNLLSGPFESTRARDVLHGPNADRFVRAAAAFALGDIKAGLADMEKALKPHEAAKWTVATYLPFLWRPEAHMFLKPEVTREFAARVGHPFANACESGLKPAVYESLLDLAARTGREIADLKPADRIDVQSFIWVVGKYKEESKPAV
ncbi:MAG: hypothetical protein ACRED9_05625 [Caulobacteraceae bacterium]